MKTILLICIMSVPVVAQDAQIKMSGVASVVKEVNVAKVVFAVKHKAQETEGLVELHMDRINHIKESLSNFVSDDDFYVSGFRLEEEFTKKREGNTYNP